jgi:Uma2 family endonuclease
LSRRPETTPVQMTPAEYLARERAAGTKNEYLSGFMVPMPASNRDHNFVTGDIALALHRQLRDRPCDVLFSTMRVKIAATGNYVYPDVIVACGDIQLEDEEEDTLLTPTVSFEVYSPATERNDRGPKFASYRQLSTLQEYLLVAQDRPSVEHYIRQGDRWVLTTTSDLGATIYLPSIDCDLPLNDVYIRIVGAERNRPSPDGA